MSCSLKQLFLVTHTPLSFRLGRVAWCHGFLCTQAAVLLPAQHCAQADRGAH